MRTFFRILWKVSQAYNRGVEKLATPLTSIVSWKIGKRKTVIHNGKELTRHLLAYKKARCRWIFISIWKEMTNDYGFSIEIGSSRSYPSTLTVLNYPKTRYLCPSITTIKTGINCPFGSGSGYLFGSETGIDFPFRGLTFFPSLSVQCTIQNKIVELCIHWQLL